jgi:tRNA(Ser,Leu) C12 N-acetylase TAN1
MLLPSGSTWKDCCRLAGRRFYVRLERRGHKGEILSPEAERTLDAFIKEELMQRGETAEIDFNHPDAIVALETLGDRLGVGLLTRECSNATILSG